ncbi:hypothetical protein CMI37_24345 [Candidatus Pacearchaeota archaeon]|nr:hypothetical protein [Candidatus Pacearchaeota archaeon]
MNTKNTEKEKYTSLYSGKLHEIYMSFDLRGQTDGGYGRANWGENIMPLLNDKKAKSIIDYGCGYGKFCDLATQSINKVYGLDIASVATGNIIDNDKITFLDGNGTAIDLPDNEVDWVTSFDCLEHIAEADLNTVLQEFDRVSTKGFALSVTFSPDSIGNFEWTNPLTNNNEPCILHLTVKPKEWWIGKLSNYGKVYEHGLVPDQDYGQVPYIIVEK